MTIHEGENLYRTNDGRIVAAGDTDAAFLVVATGSTIPAEYAEAIAAYTTPKQDTAKQVIAPSQTKRGFGPAEDK